MPNTAKIEKVRQISADLKAADLVWVVDYRGLTVSAAEQLRRDVRATGASFKVYKNTLTKLALADAGLPALDEILQGPSAFVFAEGEPVESAKALKNFAKAHDALEIKGGILNGAVVSVEHIKAIADLPTREELLAKLLGTLSNPASKLVRTLNEIPAQLVRTLGAMAKKAA
ncbi:MAG: 50S ribosomal protein L10 [Coriobacteriales bacterium]|jgi:large subunit ribosomal protein L10|nr:50S ribosomal protein L10 [Coriobacteriales bacterium]